MSRICGGSLFRRRPPERSREPSASARDSPSRKVARFRFESAANGDTRRELHGWTAPGRKQPRHRRGREGKRRHHPPLLHVAPLVEWALRGGINICAAGAHFLGIHAEAGPSHLGLRRAEHRLPERSAHPRVGLAEREPSPEHLPEHGEHPQLPNFHRGVRAPAALRRALVHHRGSDAHRSGCERGRAGGRRGEGHPIRDREPLELESRIVRGYLHRPRDEREKGVRGSRRTAQAEGV